MAFPINRPVLLSDVIRETRWLEITCRQCGRFGRLSVRRLLAEHGAAATAWSVVEMLTADCPQRAPGIHYTKECRPSCPTLARHMPPLEPYRPPSWAGKRRD